MAAPSTTGSPYHHRRRALVGAGAGMAVTAAVVALFVSTLHTELVTPPPSKLVLDRHGAVLTEVPGEGERLGYWPPPYILPERMVRATLETEDRHFYEHGGVRLASLGRAVWQNVKSLRVVSGASTLAMQVARMQSGRERTLISKLKEALEARELVDAHGHDAVLRQYLTLAPYGNRLHGVSRAARAYFDKPVEDLSWLQAAYLAALPQAPARMNPYDVDGRARGLARAHRILRTLHARGVIDADELAVALASDLAIVDRRPRDQDAVHAAIAFGARAQARPALTQQSTLDLDIQHTVAHLLSKNLAGLRERGATNSAVVVVDRARGDVLAYVASAGYFDKDARGAIDFLDTKRSPGSTLKPFIYGKALESGRYTAATMLLDTPMDFVTENGRSYLPKNINKMFLGPLSVREALGNSRNIPALRVLSEIGVEPVLSALDEGGVGGVSYEPGRYGLGLALGNLHTTPLELAALYRALAEGGLAKPLRYFVDDEAGDGKRILSDDAAALVTHILADPAARQPSFPSGSALDYDYAVATKTGTSQGYRDGWTAAFSDRLVVVAWIGNHDWRRMNHLGGLAGTAELTHDIMDAIMPTQQPYRAVATSFPPPTHSTRRAVCALSGKLAGADCPHTQTELFLAGTEPLEPCDMHVRKKIDVRNGLLATAQCPRRFVAERSFVRLPRELSSWAQEQHLQRLPELPVDESPLCGGRPRPAPERDDEIDIALAEPRDGVRYTWDPDTPPEYATIRLKADVEPRAEQVVFLVDGAPVAMVGYPHEARWTLTPGRHTIQAALAHRAKASSPVQIVVR